MIKFNNAYLPTEIPGLMINNIKRDILPPRAVNMIDVPARMGAYFLNVKNGVRTYNASVTLKGSTLEDVRLKMRDLAEILNTKKLAPLVFDDESYKTYMAVAVDKTELDEEAKIARGTISFLVPDPVGIGATQTESLGAPGTIHSITNFCNEAVHPIFTVDFNTDAEFFSLISPDGFVLLGNPAGVNEATKKPREMNLHDPCDDLTPWTTTGVQLDYQYAAAAGSFAVVGDPVDGDYKFQVSDFGNDADYLGLWHGPAIRRDLPATIQDFRVEASVELKSGIDDTGRIELILFDSTGTAIAKMVLWDRYEISELTTGHIYAGNIQDQHKLIWSMGPKKNDWNQFFGKLNIRREGNLWQASIVQTDSWGRYKYGTHLHKKLNLDQFNGQVASMQIHVSKFSDSPAADMSIRDLKFQQLNQVADSEVATLFIQGDQLVIDHQRGSCYLNGERFLNDIDPASKFFKLDPGTTEVTSTTSDGANTTLSLEYQERWI